MRPVPTSRHFVAVLIFAAAAALSAYFAMHDDRLGKAQAYIAAAAAKRHEPHLFPHDPVFGPSRMWLLETPAFQGLLELVLVPTDWQDLTLPFRALTGVVTMLYLCGMYALLYRQCRSWSVSALVALLSATVVEALGGAEWGTGPLATTTPEGLCLAVLPVVLVALLHYGEHVRVLMVFAFVGLLGNLHMVTAMNVTIVLLVVYLGMHRFAPQYWPTAIGGLLCAFAAALPYLLYYTGLRIAASGGESGSTYAAARAAFETAKQVPLFPEVLADALRWEFLARLGVLLAAGATVLLRVERFRVRDGRVWTWFFLAVLIVTLGLQGVSQLIGKAADFPPPVIGFARASALLLLPLYVLLAQAITNLFRLVRVQRNWARAACGGLLCLWMVSSDNLRVARHAAYDLATASMDEASRPLAVRRHHARRQRQEELLRIADWARQNTDVGAVFLTDEPAFRMLARRAVVTCRDDVAYYYYMTPAKLADWTQRLRRRVDAASEDAGRADPAALAALVDDLARTEPFQDVPEWYTILPAALAPAQDASMALVESEQWGRHYVLARVR